MSVVDKTNVSECLAETPSPLSKVFKEIFLGSLTLLTAQCLREFLIQITQELAPEKKNSKIICLGFLALFLFLVTLIVASIWKN